MKIWVLIKKDISLCPQWIIAGIVLTLLAPVYFLYMSDLNELLLEPVFLISALFGCNIAISRICYIEDNYETQKLLNSMPISKYELVFSRYIEGLALIIILILLVIINGNFILDGNLDFDNSLMFFSIGLMFEGLYLFFFYKWGANIAQYALVALMAILGMAYLIIEKLDISLGRTSITMEIDIIFAVAGLTTYIVSALMSCKCYKSI